MSSVKDRKSYQKFVERHSVYIVIKNNEKVGRLIVYCHKKSGNESVDWTDYTNHDNDAVGKAYWFKDTMKGMKFDGHDFVDGVDPFVQMRAWGYNIVTVIC